MPTTSENLRAKFAERLFGALGGMGQLAYARRFAIVPAHERSDGHTPRHGRKRLHPSGHFLPDPRRKLAQGLPSPVPAV